MGVWTLAAGGKEERVGRAQEVEVGGRKRGDGHGWIETRADGVWSDAAAAQLGMGQVMTSRTSRRRSKDSIAPICISGVAPGPPAKAEPPRPPADSPAPPLPSWPTVPPPRPGPRHVHLEYSRCCLSRCLSPYVLSYSFTLSSVSSSFHMHSSSGVPVSIYPDLLHDDYAKASPGIRSALDPTRERLNAGPQARVLRDGTT